MENKNLIYIVGGVAVLGIAYYMYKKRQATPKVSATPVAETKSEDETKVEDEKMDIVSKAKMEKPRGQMVGKPKNPNAMEVAQSMPTSTASTPTASTPKTKLTKNEVEKRLFKKCGVKPLLNIKGSVQKYENCKNSFKNNLRQQGLISFDGMDTYSYMTSDFEISFR
jgi:hypothetical protein